jgi:hypothetical protein
LIPFPDCFIKDNREKRLVHLKPGLAITGKEAEYSGKLFSENLLFIIVNLISYARLLVTVKAPLPP